MEYLTTHDLVWINNSIIGEPQPYHYFNLEASMAGQYGYGPSRNVPEQAATMLERLISKAPFEQGNLRTAYIATLTFLAANGYASQVEDNVAAEIVRSVAIGTKTSLQAVSELTSLSERSLDGGISLRKLISHVCNRHSEALKSLAEAD